MPPTAFESLWSCRKKSRTERLSPNTLLLYAEDHTRYSTSFDIGQQKSLTGNTPVLSATVNFEGTAGGTWEAPALYLEEATGREAALRHCAERIAKAMHARSCMPPAFFWSSWYYAYETMDQAMLEEILVGIANERTPFRYLELDAGYRSFLERCANGTASVCVGTVREKLRGRIYLQKQLHPIIPCFSLFLRSRSHRLRRTFGTGNKFIYI